MRVRVVRDVKRAEQFAPSLGYVLHRGIERPGVGLRRLVIATDLSDELEGGVVELRVTRRVIRVAQSLDVPTHGIASPPS